MSQKLHNPKSHAPAVYIPCWLIQVSIKLISNGAKMTYGRLSQWASSNGTVFRSAPQLAEELGCSKRSIEEYLRELKTVGLIGTYQPQAGGVNHYEFYDHPWMHEPIKDQLVYKEDITNPPHHSVAPPTSECGTPPHPSVCINKKQIKINKKNNKQPHSVVVFSDTSSVVQHLKATAKNRRQFLTEQQIEEIIFTIGQETDFDLVMKKINISLKLIQEGKWTTPYRFNKALPQKKIETEQEKQERWRLEKEANIRNRNK